MKIELRKPVGLEKFRNFVSSNQMELERILAEVYTAFLKDRSDFVLFDGGAHKGFHTTKMLDLPGCKAVYAVEADPFMFQELQNKLGNRLQQACPRVYPVQKALQSDPTLTSIFWGSSSSHVGRSSIISDNAERPTIWGDNPDIEYREEMTVTATTIDAILKDEPAPLPFMKLDLEGADLMALQGATLTLEEKRPLVASKTPCMHQKSMASL